VVVLSPIHSRGKMMVLWQKNLMKVGFYVDVNFSKIIEKNPIEDELLPFFCKKGYFNKEVALL
jgi:hypothetical protein